MYQSESLILHQPQISETFWWFGGSPSLTETLQATLEVDIKDHVHLEILRNTKSRVSCVIPYGSMATVWEGTANPPNYSKLYLSPTSFQKVLGWIHRDWTFQLDSPSKKMNDSHQKPGCNIDNLDCYPSIVVRISPWKHQLTEMIWRTNEKLIIEIRILAVCSVNSEDLGIWGMATLYFFQLRIWRWWRPRKSWECVD